VTAVARRDRLARRRKSLGLTQDDLAALLGVQRSTVVRWERGVTQPAPWLRPRLARALKVSPERTQELLAGAESARPRDAPETVPRQLPAAVPDFTGREAELTALTRMLDKAETGGPGTVVISAIGGTAGVGKTALALYWAHQVAGQFPDGQLHANLRGFDPAGTPVAPADAIRGFLDALGVPPGGIPPNPDAQAGLYRTLLADKRMLILLDNARDEQQVRPLLPASPASLVLVTSRNQLTGLAAADGARTLTLDLLREVEAVQLLTARLGAGRARDEPEAVAEIATLCACLPLALAVAAARAAARPGFPLSALAAELRAAAGRLDALDAGEPAASVQAVLSWSYHQLSPPSARMFRLLGLHPGPDITAPAAASLAAISEPEARRLLRDLTRACLITEHVPGRYGCHDLLRAYAAALTLDLDTQADRSAAVGRILDHYLHAAHDGRLRLMPRSSRYEVVLTPPGPGTVLRRFADYRQAMAWFEAECDVLLAAVTLAGESGFERHAWQIAWATMPFLARRGRYQEWAATQRTALAAATRKNDILGQATASRLLAYSYNQLADYDQALACLTRSLALYQRLRDRHGEAICYQGLALVAESQERYEEALSHEEKALSLYQAIGDKANEANALNNVGWTYAILGDYRQARAYCRQAVTLLAEAGDRDRQALAWDSVGYAEHHLGNFSEAVACYERALAIRREWGDPRHEALILTHLGDTWRAAGDPGRARDAWQQALAILEDLKHPSAGDVRAKLAGL
jgi:tetratricopeptide (TPR) repeat protein/transcriptional regulator with XRE-family HTH domain